MLEPTSRLSGSLGPFPWILRPGQRLRDSGCFGSFQQSLGRIKAQDDPCPSQSLFRPHLPPLWGISATLQSCLFEVPSLVCPQVVSFVLPGPVQAVWKPLRSLNIPSNSTNAPLVQAAVPPFIQQKQIGGKLPQECLEMGVNSSSPTRDQKLRLAKTKACLSQGAGGHGHLQAREQ